MPKDRSYADYSAFTLRSKNCLGCPAHRRKFADDEWAKMVEQFQVEINQKAPAKPNPQASPTWEDYLQTVEQVDEEAEKCDDDDLYSSFFDDINAGGSNTTTVIYQNDCYRSSSEDREVSLGWVDPIKRSYGDRIGKRKCSPHKKLKCNGQTLSNESGENKKKLALISDLVSERRHKTKRKDFMDLWGKNVDNPFRLSAMYAAEYSTQKQIWRKKPVNVNKKSLVAGSKVNVRPEKNKLTKCRPKIAYGDSNSNKIKSEQPKANSVQNEKENSDERGFQFKINAKTNVREQIQKLFKPKSKEDLRKVIHEKFSADPLKKDSKTPTKSKEVPPTKSPFLKRSTTIKPSPGNQVNKIPSNSALKRRTLKFRANSANKIECPPSPIADVVENKIFDERQTDNSDRRSIHSSTLQESECDDTKKEISENNVDGDSQPALLYVCEKKKSYKTFPNSCLKSHSSHSGTPRTKSSVRFKLDDHVEAKDQGGMARRSARMEPFPRSTENSKAKGDSNEVSLEELHTEPGNEDSDSERNVQYNNSSTTYTVENMSTSLDNDIDSTQSNTSSATPMVTLFSSQNGIAHNVIEDLTSGATSSTQPETTLPVSETKTHCLSEPKKSVVVAEEKENVSRRPNSAKVYPTEKNVREHNCNRYSRIRIDHQNCLHPNSAGAKVCIGQTKSSRSVKSTEISDNTKENIKALPKVKQIDENDTFIRFARKKIEMRGKLANSAFSSNIHGKSPSSTISLNQDDKTSASINTTNKVSTNNFPSPRTRQSPPKRAAAMKSSVLTPTVKTPKSPNSSPLKKTQEEPSPVSVSPPQTCPSIENLLSQLNLRTPKGQNGSHVSPIVRSPRLSPKRDIPIAPGPTRNSNAFHSKIPIAGSHHSCNLKKASPQRSPGRDPGSNEVFSDDNLQMTDISVARPKTSDGIFRSYASRMIPETRSRKRSPLMNRRPQMQRPSAQRRNLLEDESPSPRRRRQELSKPQQQPNVSHTERLLSPYHRPDDTSLQRPISRKPHLSPGGRPIAMTARRREKSPCANPRTNLTLQKTNQKAEILKSTIEEQLTLEEKNANNQLMKQTESENSNDKATSKPGKKPSTTLMTKLNRSKSYSRESSISPRRVGHPLRNMTLLEFQAKRKLRSAGSEEQSVRGANVSKPQGTERAQYIPPWLRNQNENTTPNAVGIIRRSADKPNSSVSSARRNPTRLKQKESPNAKISEKQS